jgi:flagellar biosynthesis/type III secretory pathway M-ring protein FliF/YscJ
MDRPAGIVNNLLATIRKFGIVRVIALAGVAIGVLGAFLMLELHGVSTSRMTLLVSDLDPRSFQQAIEELDRRKIPYRIGRPNLRPRLGHDRRPGNPDQGRPVDHRHHRV